MNDLVQLIHCIHCHAIFLKTPFDRWPAYESYPSHLPDNFRSIQRDDFKDFLRHHHGHRLENLKIIEDSFVSEKSYFEPVKVSYFRATNGKENFVIKKFRESIDEPLKYELIAGDYSLRCMGIEIQCEEITKQFEQEFKATPMPPHRIAAFLKLYQRIAETADSGNFERVPEESPVPLEIFYKIDDISWVYLLRNCRNIFQEQEYSAVEAFLHRHKDDGVLLLKATYQIEIIERARPRKKTLAAQIPLEKKKIVEKA
jgi:hypothetical protein